MPSSTRFFGKTFDETVSLLEAVRDYVAHAQPTAAAGLDERDRLRIHCETMRITARLSQVLAWLLAQKAVDTGEISAEEAVGERFRLSGDEVCLPETETLDGLMPARLRELLKQSRKLYVRVARLDDLVRRQLIENG